MLSKYGLDFQPYNTTDADVTWETCTLRSWLNTTFYNTAFTTGQQSSIVSTTLTNPDNLEYGTEGGNDTADKVFLLSIEETNQYFATYFSIAETYQYFDTDAACRVTATAYAKAEVACLYENFSSWSLRSPGRDSFFVAFVSGDGDVRSGGDSVNNVYVAVRPALWINLES